MVSTKASMNVSQRSDSNLRLKVERSSTYNGFTVDLKDDELGPWLVRLHLRDEYGVEELADDLIEAGLTLKRFYEERDWEEFRQIMEEVEREKRIFEEQGQLMSSGEVNVA